MEFSGTFELEGQSREEVWRALSDPVMIRNALPGCQYLVEVESDDPDFDELRERHADDEDAAMTPEAVEERAFAEGHHYAALIEISVGSVKPSFETVVTIDEREFPAMEASGEGRSGDSSFEMSSGMTLSETDDGTAVEWWSRAEVFGRIAQMGQRVINPVANRVVKRFFNRLEEEVRTAELTAADDGNGTGDEARDGGGTGGEARNAGGAGAGARNEDGNGGGTGSDADAATGTVQGEDDGSDGSSTGATDESDAAGDRGLLARVKRLLGLGT